MIKEITQFIVDRGTLAPTPFVFTIGANLFAGHRPQGCANACDLVLETAGGEAFFEVPNRADPVIQILSRAETYYLARKRAYVIYDTIFRTHTAPAVAPAYAVGHTYSSAGWRIPLLPPAAAKTYEIMVIVPLSPPQYIGQDEKHRFEFSTNYVFKIMKL